MSDQFELPLVEHRPVEQSAEVIRTFLGWDRPLLTLAVKHLTRNWTSRIIDLGHHLIIVPTKQAGRRLRSSLALRASERDVGGLPPAVVTPADRITTILLFTKLPLVLED